MRTFTSLTWFTTIAFAGLSIGIVHLAQGESVGAAAWVVASAYLAFSVRRSVTARADDRERVAAAQPSDERDPAAIRSACSVVGQVAFLGQAGIVIWCVGRDAEGRLPVESVTVLVLGFANRASLQGA